MNCGASAENEICRSSYITTYPTLRYYLNGTEHSYTGSLALETLREFIDSTLVLPCNPIDDGNNYCSEKEKKFASKWVQKDVVKIKDEIDRLGKMIQKSEATTTADLRKWMRQRREILKLIKDSKTKDVRRDETKTYEKSDEL